MGRSWTCKDLLRGQRYDIYLECVRFSGGQVRFPKPLLWLLSHLRLAFAGAFLGHVVVLLAAETAQEAEALLGVEVAGGGIGGG